MTGLKQLFLSAALGVTLFEYSALATTMVNVQGTSEEDEQEMDHGIDFDFNTDDGIPLTPEESEQITEDDSPMISPDDSKQIAPRKDDQGTKEDSEDGSGWHYYLDFLKEYEDKIWAFVKVQLVRINRVFLTQEHHASESSQEGFKYGLYDGLFKLQPRANSNCLTDGATYFKALVHFARKAASNRFKVNAQEQFAFEDALQGFFHKCTLQDTVTGSVLISLAMFGIDEMPEDWQAQFRTMRMLLRLVDTLGFFNAVIELAYYINVSLYKTDGFTFGKITGKVAKIALQWKLAIMTSEQTYLYDSVAF